MTSTVVIGVGTLVYGSIDQQGDQDWYRVTLAAGTRYFFDQVPQPNTGHSPNQFTIYDANGVFVANSNSVGMGHAYLEFVPAAGGEYFFAAAAQYGSAEYLLRVAEDPGETIDTASPMLNLLSSPAIGRITADPAIDDDLYKVDFRAGEIATFSINLDGVGGRVSHVFLQLFDSNGELIETGTDTLSHYSGEAGTFYVSIGGLSAEVSGTYSVSFGSVDSTSWTKVPHYSLDDHGYVAPHDPGETAVIDVFLGAGGVEADDGDGAFTSRRWTADERAAVAAALSEFERVANVDFNIVSSIEQADFAMLKNNNEPHTGLDDDGPGVILGYWRMGGGELEYDGSVYDLDGIGVFNSAHASWTAESLKPGGYGYITLVHELGHSLGLKHPHSEGRYGTQVMWGADDLETLGYKDLNQGIYTAMSYNDGWITQPGVDVSPTYDWGWPSGLMTFDIAMLQQLYGAAAHATGNTSYTLPGSDKSGTAFKAIWDTGGVDTIRYTGSKDAVISLQAATLEYTDEGGGVVSYVKGVRGGFTIANGVWIENAKSGSGDDWLQGSLRENRLNGGDGLDTVDYSNRYRPIDVALAGSAAAGVSVDGKAEDVILNIENVVGGAAGDRLVGDSFGNWLTGRGGNDLLRGRGGADRFVFSAKLGAGNADIIADFKHDKDVLALDDKFFKVVGSSTLTAGEFYAKAGATKAHDKDDRVVYDKTTGDLYYDRDGKGGAAAILFATLKHAPTLDHGDFLIV